MDSEASILRSAKSFFSGTALSRVVGLLRDLSMAFCFGGAPEVAAFMVAYRLSNLFRRLLGEGNLQGGFVPQFERFRMEGELVAVRFYRDLSFSIAVFLLFFVVLGGVVCWKLSSMIQSDIPLMTLAMMPGVIFLCLYALNSSILQCQKRYFLPALAPSLFNMAWIGSVGLLATLSVREAMFGLSLCLLGAFALQWVFTAWPVFCWSKRVMPLREWLRPKLFSQEVRSLLRPIAYGVVGVGAAQINSALDAIFARIADPAGPAYLWYAIRVQQLPLALFGIALAGALLPPLSRAAQAGSMERFYALLEGSLRKGAALMIPCAFGMAPLAAAGLDLLYGRGEFTPEDVFRTALCLQGYALGLVPMVFILLYANSFFAERQYRLPMRCSLVAVGCNLALNALFVFGLHLNEVSIALATSMSAYVNWWLLARSDERKGKISPGKGMGRLLIASAGACFTVFALDVCMAFSRDFTSQMIRFILLSGSFIASLMTLVYLLNVREIIDLMRGALGRKGLSNNKF